MSTQVAIAGLSGDDLTFSVSLTENEQPLDLSTITTVTAYLKPTPGSADSAGKSYGIGSGLTVVSSATGQLKWFIPRGDVGSNRWYRFTITDLQSNLSTALFGPLSIRPV